MNKNDFLENEGKRWQKNVALFLVGQSVTLIGSSLVGYAIMWHVTLQTQSGVMMTIFTVATMLPMFFISPFGGVWADRFNRKYLINIADASIATVTLVIALCFSLGTQSIYLLLVCAIMRSLGQGVQMPAVTALIPQITPEDQLVRVNGINSSIQSLSMLGSPAIAGVLLSIAPLQTVLFIDVATAIIGISILLFFVKVPSKTAEEKELASAKSYFTDMKDGINYIKGHSFIKRFFVVSAISTVLLTPAALLAPLQVTRDFGADVWRLTAIELAFSIGMLIGGLTIAAWGGFKNKTVTLVFGALIFGATSVGFGVFTNFWIYLACMGVCGLSVPIINTPVMSILQSKVEEGFMGRVFSVVAMISSLVMPLSMVLFGPLGDVIKIDFLMIGTGIGMAILSLYTLSDRKLRDAGR
ncbi:MAG: MFS transporter [Clostridiales Family XIII bacterium]|jgi:DHA3 family macrolide efflux protein-like MFS transporter|nr:MFS transporter [Clostridiales Family XIII bacterium]